MGINIKITGSEIGGDVNILNGSKNPKNVNIYVKNSNFGDGFNVGNDSENPDIVLNMEDTYVQDSVKVAQGATNPNVNATFRNFTAPTINIPGTPTKKDTADRETESYDTRVKYKTYSDAYQKATSHPEKAHNNDLFGAILKAIVHALNPNNKDDKSKD